MAKVHDRIDDRIQAFIDKQQVFFVGTAPVGPDGHVNISPKGLADTLCVVDDHTLAYLDLTASGAETIAHVRQNGRIVVMFCSFERIPNVVRVHGHGRVVSRYDPEYAEWAWRFPPNPVARAVIVVDVTRVSTSCGYALPLLEPVAERDILTDKMARRGEEGIVRYRRANNAVSIDGLPAYTDD